MELAWLESFRVFSDTLNFTHTARVRHLSQPAVFRHIQNLSEDIGVPLYQKVGRNLFLTDAGRRMARMAREWPDRLDEMYREVRDRGESAIVRLSAGQGAYLYLLGPAIQKFMKKGRVRLAVRSQEQSLADLREGRAHLAVTVLDVVPEDLEAKLLYEVGPRLVVPRGHRLASRKSVSLSALDAEPLIVPSSGKPMRANLESRFAAEKLEFVPSLEADGWEVMMNFVSLGLGSAIVNGCCRPPRGTHSVRLRGLPKTRYYVLRPNDGFRFDAMDMLRNDLIEQTKKVELFAEANDGEG